MFNLSKVNHNFTLFTLLLSFAFIKDIPVVEIARKQYCYLIDFEDLFPLNKHN